MQTATLRAGLRAAILAVFALAVSACLLSPGKFTSNLDIRRDGSFAFSYTGEIHMLALSKLAQGDQSGGVFKPRSCYDDDGLEERPCTAEDTEQQKREWEDARKRTAESRKQETDSMKAIFGGIDPGDPRAAEELAQRLRRQAGWRKVEYKGDGLFDVDFAIAGQLGHDFVFPTMERFPLNNSFVLVALRQDGTVRVDAPGFGPASSGESSRGMMQLGGIGGEAAPGDGMPIIDGKFTIRTDGEILANNTDTGPQPDSSGRKLEWPVNIRTPAAPTALIRLKR